MKNNWSDQDVKAVIDQYNDIPEDIALRVYTSQLIGRESQLVMHGGGNTSVKTVVKNQLGEDVEVIAVKGSGWDLSTIEPPGFPCVDLEHCRKLRQLPSLSDEHMVNELRTHMLDHKAPNPSVETLLHAFLPHKFVDHSHSDAILTIVDQENAVEICKEIYGDTFGIVEYIMPGFALSKKAAEVYEANPNVKGLLLLQHGLFTFGKTAKESYDAHIEAVTNAEEYIAKATRKPLTPAFDGTWEGAENDIFPMIRGIYEQKTGKPWILHHRVSDAALAFANSKEVEEWSQRGTLTPDHVIRTKPSPLLLKATDSSDKDALRKHVEEAIDDYCASYHTYFTAQNERCGGIKIELDRMPRVFLIQGVGLVSVATNMKAAKIAADLYEHTVEVIQDAMAIGSYYPVSTADLFDMEYWSLEQAKLGKKKAPQLEGRVTYVTGAASGIGQACAELFGEKGSLLYLVDINQEALDKTIADFRSKGIVADGQVVDVTSPEAIAQSFGQVIAAYGGVDYVISNAGKAFQAPIDTCPNELLEKSFALNFFSHQYVASEATKIMKAQGVGGALVFNVSKAAFNPGAQFGPYALPKAASLALMKQYAIEGGPHGIRSNAINADRIKTGLFTEDFVKERAAARGLEPSAYFRSNLLKAEVTARDVAQEFLNLALATKTTAATVTVDGGNIAASPR